jgi:transcriptional regulator with XRE-family HTH domain
VLVANEALRRALLEAGMSPTDLAARVEVDPKTVERWVLNDRLPQRRHRHRTSRVLNADEKQLWPQLLEQEDDDGYEELVAFYPQRGAVPSGLWQRLIHSARQNVDVLVYAGLFLVDSNPELPAVLAEQARSHMQVRLLYGDPDSETVAWRGREEGIGEHLAARIRLTMTYMRPLVDVAGIEIRQHESILYNSIYRFDDEMLVNTHVAGSPAPQNPVLHLRRTPEGRLFDHYVQSIDRVWESAQPLGAALSA